jgi:starch phosphorylase
MTTLDLEVFFTPLPRRIARLRDLAYNLWWSWHPEAQELYWQIDPDLWELVYHNPVRFLHEVRQRRLDQAAGNPAYLQQYDAVMNHFDTYMSAPTTWWSNRFPTEQDDTPGTPGTIAYFSAEFGIHECLPIYSGGLGILAGDHVKEASDMGVPLVAVGFVYPQGYFRQHIDPEGRQFADYEKLHFSDVPVIPARTPTGGEVVVGVEVAGRMIYAKVYRIQVGRTPLFLMDTDIHPNSHQSRDLLARLYGGDQEMRIAQEVILGIGGVRVLRQLGIHPDAWHMNEGHAAFLVLERMREQVSQGTPFEQAAESVRARTIFTSHTPAPASHDVFPAELIEKYFWRYWPQLGIGHDTFIDLARMEEAWSPDFSMTALALNFANCCNGVSKLHSQVLRNRWNWMYPGSEPDKVPIRSISNGVHAASWIAPEVCQTYDTYLGQGWESRLDDADFWQRVYDIPNDVLWSVRRRLRHALIAFVRERTRQRFQRLDQQPVVWPILEEDALSIGFARRFASYKRATLIFRDLERLKLLLNAPGRPVQIIFAGKAHPADEAGTQLIQDICQLAHQPGLAGRIVFLEEYDIAVGRELVRGVDLWLNTPRRPFEASGTSGQKACLNGVPTLSVLDGWWPEAYNGRNGWAIGEERTFADQEEQDTSDAESLYHTLEQEVIPLFYDQRDEADVPNSWLEVCKEAIVSVVPHFSTRRMLKDYIEHFYLPTMGRGSMDTGENDDR